MMNEEKANLRLIEMEPVEEERLTAKQNLELYRQRMSNDSTSMLDSAHFTKVI